MIDIKDKQNKLNTHYKVRESSVNSVKDIDLSKRIVTGLFNTYFYIDTDGDMLIPGASLKSINDRGPESNAAAKIKHLKDHDWGMNMARIQVLDEREVEFNGKKLFGIYHESYYPDTTLANDMLINIQEGIYDNRSIGFRYMDIAFASKDSNIAFERMVYDEYIQKAINPEAADRYGYFWVVKEIKLYEGSDVTFGANSQTPMLGVKSENKDILLLKTFDRIDKISYNLKNGKQSDETMREFEIQLLQLKQVITELIHIEPSIKDTLKSNEIIKPSEIIETQKQIQTIDYNKILNNLNF